MATVDSYYKILRVKPGASLQEINQAYINLLSRLHPFRSSDDPRQRRKAQAMAKELNEAYEKIKKAGHGRPHFPKDTNPQAARDDAPGKSSTAAPLKSLRLWAGILVAAVSVTAAVIAIEGIFPPPAARRTAPPPPTPARIPIIRQAAAPALPVPAAPQAPVARRSSVASPTVRKGAPPPPVKSPPVQAAIGRQTEKSAVAYAAAVRQAAERGDGDAQGWLAYLYAIGKWVSQNYSEAALWYRRAADQGNAGAQDWLGYLYETGRGVPQDYSQAALWYRRAADRGDDEAQKNLAFLYANGRGVAKNLREAVKWYSRAANLGNFEAQRALEIRTEP